MPQPATRWRLGSELYMVAKRAQGRHQGSDLDRGGASIPTGSEAVARVRELALAGQQEQAIAACSEALAGQRLKETDQLDLLDLRAESQIAIGDFDAALADAKAMQTLAKTIGSATAQALAGCRLALVQVRRDDNKAAARTARHALASARKSRDTRLEALALHRLSEALWSMDEAAAGLRCAQQAGALFERLGDALWQGRSLWSQAMALFALGQRTESKQSAEHALALAEQTGDQFGLGNAYNVSFRMDPDLALRLQGLKQAIAAFGAAGYSDRQSGIRHNLALVYHSLGLYSRARRIAIELMQSKTHMQSAFKAVISTGMLAWVETELHHFEAARLRQAELSRIEWIQDAHFAPWLALMNAARIAEHQGDWQGMRRHAQAAILAAQQDDRLLIVAGSMLAKALLKLGQRKHALTESRRAFARLEARDSFPMMGVFSSPLPIWWVQAQCLEANGRSVEAASMLERCYRYLCDSMANVSDAGLRRSGFNKVADNREVIAAWCTQVRRAGLAPGETLPHLAFDAGNLREPFERLSDAGLRMNELRSSADLHEFLVDEATELSGAERAMLVLDTPAGLHIAGAQLPQGEDATALLQTITPWLLEAHRTRAVSLRHGPDGAAAIDQRSCVVAPLIAQQQLLGFLYADIEGLFGRFADSDRDLLAMLASQAAVALANLRAAEGLEAKVAERTTELERRAHELTVINSIQQGMAAKLEFQAIVDIVGDKLREVLRSGDVQIVLWNAASGTAHPVYAFERGVRIEVPPMRPNVDGPMFKALLSKQAVIANNRAEMSTWGLHTVDGTRPSLATAITPVFSNDRYIGAIVLENHERESAFGESEVRLLSTVAASMGVALESARLFDETQRLFKQSEQRAAELAIVNSVQAALASKLDVQAIHQLVGDKLRDVFDAQSVLIGLFDHTQGIEVFTYSWEKGQYHAAPPRPLNGLRRHLIATRQTLFNNHITPEASARFGAQPIGDTQMPKSSIFVPMLVGDEVKGYVSIQNVDHFEAFTEADVRLLETLTSSLSVAFENARLFNETQRLIKETREALERQTATADVLRVLGSSMTDPQPVFDAIVANCSNLFPGSRVVLWLKAEGELWASASNGDMPSKPLTISRASPIGACVMDAELIYLPDMEAMIPKYPMLPELGVKYGYRSGIYAPLVHGGEAVGVLVMRRKDLNAFNERDVALLRTFTDQAVIATQNVRLFNDTKQALEQQTASAEILKVISESPTDVRPVFDAIVGTALRLLSCDKTFFLRRDGDNYDYVTGADATGLIGSTVSQQVPIDASLNFPSRVFVGKTLLHLPDWSQIELPEHEQRVYETRGVRSSLMLPLLLDGECASVLVLARSKQEAFDDREIALAKSFVDQAVIAIQNVHLFNETKEALERQTATAEILAVIADSPEDVQPVLDAIVESAKRLIGGFSATAFRVFDGMVHLAAFTATDEAGAAALQANFPAPLSAFYGFEPLRSGRVIQVEDTETDPQVTGEWRELARRRHYRANINVPMLRDGVPIGMFSVTRAEPGPFARHHVDLLQSFAAQAVIAIQNTHLFNETKQALERQTATSDILKAIAGSPSDVQPVFDVIVERAVTLCGAQHGRVMEYDGSLIKLVASCGVTDSGLGVSKKVFPRPATDDTIAGIVIKGRQPYLISDIELDTGVPELSRQMIVALGTRSQVVIPMLATSGPIGIIVVGWSEPNAFDEAHVSLLKTFADQAVIAIHNVRLFNETKEALERQTATAEILKVIASSPSDVQPVFDAIVNSSRRLVDGFSATVFRIMDGMTHLVGLSSTNPAGDEALRSFYPQPLSQLNAGTLEALSAGRSVFIEDVETDDRFTGDVRNLARLRGFRSLIVCPLRRNELLGYILVTRAEPGNFTSYEAELLTTFADQAVIAIENVRLFNETKEALEQQTATAEILKVISGSVTDTQPVFDAIVQSCQRLLGGKAVALAMPKGSMIESLAFASDGKEAIAADSLEAWPLDHGSGAGSCILDSQLIEVTDTASAAARFPRMPQLALALGYHSALFVPLLREAKAIGCLAILREAAGDFDAQEVALAQTFADQAVIAIENARLFNETKEALERQTATADILAVISASPTDVQPVFQAIAERARILCKAHIGATTRLEGDVVHMAGVSGMSEEAEAAMRGMFPVARELAPPNIRRSLAEQVLIQIPDVQVEPGYPSVETSRVTGVRSIMSVPLLHEGRSIGTIGVARNEPGVFPEAAVALLQTFARQAVIAIHNVRLFNETKEALEQQRTSAEVLNVISNSVADTAPVFEAISKACQQLFSGDQVVISVVGSDGQVSHAAMAMSPGFDASSRDRAWKMLNRGFPRPLHQGYQAYPIRKRRVVHYPDIANGPKVPEGMRQMGRDIGNFSMLIAPMLWEDQGIGTIHIVRTPPRPFAEKESQLLATFADQAVIAIQNARLFNETKEALARQTATAEVLEVIGNSVADTAPVFDRILAGCERLFKSNEMIVFELGDDDLLCIGAARGPRPDRLERMRALFPRPVQGTATELAIRERRLVTYADVLNDPDVPAGLRRVAQEFGMTYSVAVAPMLRDDRAIGSILVARDELRAFDATEQRMLQTFADQAVIAIQNARLFNETQEALARQTATSEVLQVISESPTDVQPVFDIIAERAASLTAGRYCLVTLLDGAQVRLVSMRGVNEAGSAALREAWPQRLQDSTSISARSIRERGVVNVADLLALSDADYAPEMKRACELAGFRSGLAVPMLRDQRVIGAITVNRAEPGLYADKEIALLQTFARQAVVAIDNVRLFKETKEALEQQTATAEVLQVISGSVADVAPVFDKILESCGRLFRGAGQALNLLDDNDVLHLAAQRLTRDAWDQSFSDTQLAAISELGNTAYPIKLTAKEAAWMRRAKGVYSISDVLNDPKAGPAMRAPALAIGFSYAQMGATMFSGERCIGNIVVNRNAGDAFTAQEQALLMSFADQAVIAIQNARLFNEMQEALERQTATAEILQVIGRSVSDTAPVFEAIVRSCKDLFKVSDAGIGVIHDDDLVYLEAHVGASEESRQIVAPYYPVPVEKSMQGLAIQRRDILDYPDVLNGPEVPWGLREIAQKNGRNYSCVVAPMMWQDRGVGALHVTRFPPPGSPPSGFEPREIES